MLSRKTIPFVYKYPIMTFYVTFIYVIFRLFRQGLVPQTNTIQIVDSPDPSKILELIETINMYRNLKKYKQEEELYFLLIDIMRSPLLFKEITGSSLKKAKGEKEKQD